VTNRQDSCSESRDDIRFRRVPLKDIDLRQNRNPVVGSPDRFSVSRSQDSNARGTPLGRPGSGSGGITAAGILDSRLFPDSEFAALWKSLVFEDDLKDRLLSHAVLNFTLRGKIDRAYLPLHGILVLAGPPGTGKTSLARGLASAAAGVVTGLGDFLYIEVDPHTLASAALGKSQKAVTELLGSTIAECAATHPLIVLLDEVETLAVDRSRLSLDANPIDVHRSTDAVLAQLDQLADRCPNVLFIATSNFPQAIDSALLSRADLIVTVPTPGPEARKQILLTTLHAMAKEFPRIDKLTSARDFNRLIEACRDLDGRAIRKLVAAACAFDKHTALDPNRLTMADLLRAAEQARAGTRLEGATR
jgi:SpoVK/Ycf46/Vps4 family AAA+-type ATPase